MNEKKERSTFSGSIGFVLAAAGSAVGLGNISGCQSVIDQVRLTCRTPTQNRHSVLHMLLHFSPEASAIGGNSVLFVSLGILECINHCHNLPTHVPNRQAEKVCYLINESEGCGDHLSLMFGQLFFIDFRKQIW